MLTYWLLFLYPAFFALFKTRSKISWLHKCLLLATLSIIIGLRYEVGGDWEIYLENQELYATYSFAEVASNLMQDPGYELISKLSCAIGLGIYGSNLVCAVIFSLGLVAFCAHQKRPWLAITLSIPYLVIVVAMGYTRQATAIGFVMLGLIAIEKASLKQFLICIFCASLFHKTAVIASVLALPAVFQKGKLISNLSGLLLLFTAAIGIGYTLLLPRLDFYFYGYESQAMQSQGAAIRVAMVVVPAIVFILFHKKLNLSRNEKFIWLLISWVGLSCAVMLLAFDSSTAVDRIALYCIPLQMYVGSRIPDFGLLKANPKIMTAFVVVAAALVQFVWLNFADTAFAWLPYRNILLI